MRRQHFVVILVFILSVATRAQERSPGVLAKAIADKLVADTEFGFRPAHQEAVQDGSYALDFYDSFGYYPSAVFAARTEVAWKDSSAPRTRALLGFSHSQGTLEVLLNGRSVYLQTTTGNGHFKHVDYGLFEYQASILLDLRSEVQSLGFKFTPSGTEARVVLGVLRIDNGLPHPGITFRSPIEKKEDQPFIILGPCAPNQFSRIVFDAPSGSSLLNASYEGTNGQVVRWDIPRSHLLRRLPGPLALQDWRYFTGTFLDALYAVNDQFPALDYSGYINHHLDFFLTHRESVAEERKRYGLRESPFGHYFRFSLLDDMGMQTVPFIERLRRVPGKAVGRVGERQAQDSGLVQKVIDHIMGNSTRLPDGTFARLTPDTMTVWADDLFMGTVVLVRLATLTGEPRLLDEAVKQVIQFDKVLKDPKTNLYWHGWFSRTRQPSSSKWARANGWVMMAKAELLLGLPHTHGQREEILRIFSDHADGLLRVQSTDGRWHQVLENRTTYFETSATAMFIRTFALGVTKGWLQREEYDRAIRRGWQALSSQIKDDGTVEGIVRGTPIMFSDAEYQAHPPRSNDPRGLGAVLYALVALDQYLQSRR